MSDDLILLNELGPIGTWEARLTDLLRWVHGGACVAGVHDAYCNVLRRLVEDWQQLLAEDRERRRHGL